MLVTFDAQLGNGEAPNARETPVAVSGMASGVLMVAAGHVSGWCSAGCVMFRAANQCCCQRMRCVVEWLDSTNLDIQSRHDIWNAWNLPSLAQQHTCAIAGSPRGLWCWGWNPRGQVAMAFSCCRQGDTAFQRFSFIFWFADWRWHHIRETDSSCNLWTWINCF